MMQERYRVQIFYFSYIKNEKKNVMADCTPVMTFLTKINYILPPSRIKSDDLVLTGSQASIKQDGHKPQLKLSVPSS